MKNLIHKLTLALSILFVISCKDSKNSELSVQPQKVVSINDNEDFLWVASKTNEFSYKIANHLSSLSDKDFIAYSEILKEGTVQQKELLMIKILNFESRDVLYKFMNEYNNNLKNVSLFIKKNSIPKSEVDAQFKKVMYNNFKMSDACSQYQNCVQKKFAEGAVTGFFGGGLGGWAGALMGAAGGATGSAIWHATFGDCSSFRENCNPRKK